MQKHKPLFRDPTVRGLTLGDVQRCLRLTDLAEIGDGRHSLVFHMLGLFSFRQWTVPEGLEAVYAFYRILGVPLTHVTVHPDRLDDWFPFHAPYGLPVRPDSDCLWSDGDVKGYCTEFYVGDLEVGNLVNPLGDCLDIGLGLERVGLALGAAPASPEDHLRNAVLALEQDGMTPGPKAHGYVVRRLLRELRHSGSGWDHPWLIDERNRHERQRQRYLALAPRVGSRTPEWWWDTHGIESEIVLDATDPSWRNGSNPSHETTQPR